MDPVDLIIASLDVTGAFPNTPWLLLEAVWKRLGLPFYNFASGYIRTRKYTVRTGAGLTPFLEPGSRVPQGGAEGPFLYLLVTLPLALAIEQDYPAYAPYPLLPPLVGSADDTNLTVAHTPHETHAPDPGPTVTQQANDLLDMTVSYLSHNNLIVHPTKSVAIIKGSATPPTLGQQGSPMQVVTTTTHLGVIQAANPEGTTLPPKLQSHLAHLPRYASPTTKALPLSHQSLAYYLTGVLNASIGFKALHHRPPASHTRHDQGMGSTRGLAHLHTQPRHPSGMAPLWGRHRGRGESGLHQTDRPPPSPHDPKPLTGGPRGHHNPPPSRTTGPQHMPALGTPPDGHAHQHEHAPVEPPAASPPIPTPRHTHQPHVPRGRTSSGPLRGPPPSAQGHHPHRRPCRGLHHRSIRHPPPKCGSCTTAGHTTPPFYSFTNNLSTASSTSTSRRGHEQRDTLCREAKTCKQPTESSQSNTPDPSL